MKIDLQYKDESKVWVLAPDSVKMELSDSLTYMVPGYQYMPKFKRGFWDGKIRLFNPKSDSLHAGLIPEVAKFCQRGGYPLIADVKVKEMFLNKSFSEEAFSSWMDKIEVRDDKGETISPYDHQLLAVSRCLSSKRLTLLSPTSSGKSLIIYLISRYLSEVQKIDGKILIIVPTTGLVEQMHKDFMVYSNNDPSLPSDFQVHRIYAGKDKESSAQIFVSTWQSLIRLPKSWFDPFKAVVVDECHNSKGPSLQGLMENCSRAEFRLGTTGTLDGSKVNSLVVKGALGPITRFVTTSELMDMGVVARLKIINMILGYSASDRDLCSKMDFAGQQKFVTVHKRRTEFIKSLVGGFSGNSLVLFNHKSHGKKIFDELQGSSRRCFLLSGDNPVEERILVKKIMETETNVDLVASYGIFSTGESVKNIQHVVFASSSKSRIRVLQSIGRGLRVMAGKSSVNLWDLVDDLSTKTKSGDDKKTCHSMKHFRERVKIYDSESFDYETRSIDITGEQGDPFE